MKTHNLARSIIQLQKLNQVGMLPWDVVLYSIESLARAELSKGRGMKDTLRGMRCYRDSDGILRVDWLDGSTRVYK